MTAKALSYIRRKLRVLNYAKEIGNVSKACRYYGIIISGNEPMRKMERKLSICKSSA